MLAQMISCHTIAIDQARTSSFAVVQPSCFGGTQPSTFGGRGPSIGGDRPTYHDPEIEPHVCKICSKSYYGRGPTHGTTTMIVSQVRTL